MKAVIDSLRTDIKPLLPKNDAAPRPADESTDLSGLTAADLPGGNPKGPDIEAIAASIRYDHPDRERIDAVIALARTGAKTSLRPLVDALGDRSTIVRGIAAAGLGKLGHRAALPALRRARSDEDALVSLRASQAIAQICESNGLECGAGSPPPTGASSADVYVTLNSSSDDSEQDFDGPTRKIHADAVRAKMKSLLAAARGVTADVSQATRLGLEFRNLDVSITSLETRENGAYMEIEAQLRVAISDRRGKMLWFLSGGAKVQVSRRSFRSSQLPQLRREALENAVLGLSEGLLDKVKRPSRP